MMLDEIWRMALACGKLQCRGSICHYFRVTFVLASTISRPISRLQGYKTMSGTMRLFFLLIILMAPTVEVQAHTIITRMTDRQDVSLSQLAAVAVRSDLVLIGEVHDNKDHHDLQLDLIRALFAGNPQLAIGLEMIQTDHQQQLDEWTGGRMSEQAMQAVFVRNWSPVWHMYRGIFVFARDNHIPMVALNVPIEIVRKVSQQGFASLTREEKKGLPEGTSCDLRNPQIGMLRKSFQEVPNHLRDGRMFNNFCEAQTVRNSGMAINMMRYNGKVPDRKIVVLTGIWHAVKYAIPDQLERFGSRLSYTVILPETPLLNSNNSSSSEADYLVEL